MIADRTTAETLFKAAFDAYCGVDAALSAIAPNLSATELSSAKRAVGRVMGEILFQITEPILKVHPALLPDAWNDNIRNA